nr:phage head closure protein [Clostridium indicum]
MKKRVTIMRYKDTPNELGNTVSTLQRYKTVFAEIRPIRGREYLEYYKDSNSLEYKITIRYIPDLLSSDVLEYHGRQFLINSIINVEEQGYIQEVMCTEKIHEKKPEAENGV